MKKEEIHLSDWERILFGNAPAEFLLEVFLRTVLIYIALVIIMRLLGKRMNAQLTISELAVMITLGAIVSVPMQVPDRGLIQGIIILCCALIFQRGLTWLAFKYRKVEVITQGDVVPLVKDGVMQLEQMEKSRVSKNQLFATLRSKDIRHLGEVKRVYLEACGHFSVYRENEEKPGLSVFPGKDKEFMEKAAQDTESSACANCGNVVQLDHGIIETCTNCREMEWIKAVC